MNRSDRPNAPHLSGEYLWHDNIAIGMAILSEKNELLRVNRALCLFLGYPRRELLGKTVRDITHPDDWDNTARKIRKLHTGGQPFSRFEKRFLHRSGKTVWGEVNSSLIEDGSRKPRYRLTQVVDITERKRIEESLRQSHEQHQRQHAELDSIYSTAPLGLCLLDRDLRYVRINEALAAMNGKSVAAHLGRTIWETIPNIAARTAQAFRQVLEQGQPLINEEIVGSTDASPDGQRAWWTIFYPIKSAD